MFPFATPRVARGFQSKQLKSLIPFLKKPKQMPGVFKNS
jgi:hypothetical protein